MNFIPKNNKPQPPPQIQVDVSDLPDIKCKCGNNTFIQGTQIKKVSAIISPDGQDKYIFNQVKVCIQCFTPLPDKP